VIPDALISDQLAGMTKKEGYYAPPNVIPACPALRHSGLSGIANNEIPDALASLRLRE